MKNQILIVNDDLPIAALPADFAENLQVTSVTTGREGLDVLARPMPWAAMLVAVQLPDMSAVVFFRLAAAVTGATPLLLVPDQDLPDILHRANSNSVFRVVPTSTPSDILEKVLRDGVEHWQLIERELHFRQQVAHLSNTDPLTGCGNRLSGIQHLDRELSRSRRYEHSLTVILCDIDGLRMYNEAYGHQAGDKILTGFARLAMESVRQEIDTVSRWGEDEFLVILPETAIRGAGKVATRLCARFAALDTVVESQNLNCSASFGVTGYTPDLPNRNITVEELLLIASRCLSQAKAAGGNQVLCCP